MNSSSKFAITPSAVPQETDYDEYSTDFLPLNPIGLWALALCVFLPLCIATITGNVLVIVAFKKERKLRTVTNYFLVSLAVSDLIIGLISMPMYSIYVLKVSYAYFQIPFLEFVVLCGLDAYFGNQPNKEVHKRPIATQTLGAF